MSGERIYLDTNVPMYAAGRDHPLKAPAVALLQAIADEKLFAATSAETFQEILHRYRHIGELQLGLALFDSFRDFMHGFILSTTLEDVILARRLLEEVPELDARDAMHAGVMLNNGITTIISADRSFAHLNRLRWVPLEEWSLLLGP